MTMQSERRRRSRLSLLSLLLLLVLIVLWIALQCSSQREGRIGSITTAQVQIGVGASPTPLPPDFTPFPGATRTPVPGAATPTVTRPQTGVVPGIQAEVLGAGATGAATATPATGQPPPAEETQIAGATSTAVVGATATAAAGATSTPGTGATPQPTIDFGPQPTATATPPSGGGGGGSSGSLAMDGFVAPGAYKNASIRVTNNGPVTFHYSLSMSTSGDAVFASTLRLRVYVRVGDSCDFPGQPPSGNDFSPLTGDQVGTVLYDGNFASGNKFGDPSIEIAAGDRQLAPGQTEVLCFELFFPWGAGDENQGLHVNGTLIFTAKSPDS